jgi:hypothetical protein
MTRPLAARLAALAALAGTAACGSSGGSTNGTNEAGTLACAASTHFTAAAPACNTLMNSATAVPGTMPGGAPPAATGGTIRDGLYVAIRTDAYGSQTPSGRRLSLAILDNGAQMMFAGDVLDASGTQTTLTFRANATIVVSGNQITPTATCSSTSPAPLPGTFTFTAVGDQLALGNVTGGNGAITTYMRTGCP